MYAIRTLFHRELFFFPSAAWPGMIDFQPAEQEVFFRPSTSPPSDPWICRKLKGNSRFITYNDRDRNGINGFRMQINRGVGKSRLILEQSVN